MQVIAGGLKLGGQGLEHLLGVLKFHVEHTRHEVGETHVPVEDLLLTNTEKYAVALVETKVAILVVFGEHGLVVLQGLLVIAQVVTAEFP